ncbi:hypothetical protein EI42_01726 [Thermosporothrix hazakensis]|uniref:Uncharacterized protein n=2 Tax=Thermosporothrix hazakensis TaxID=644383 RepID=A0A326UD43_THEHA|nr:hypothetical protein EI42_01726 [Thermosporothrix hazakensis]GCE49987.1 hypothetical protein KTH_48560 [Thermosporothrix hazakensis]
MHMKNRAATTSSGLVFHFPVAATPTKIPKLLRVLLHAQTPIRRAKDLDKIAFAEYSDTNRFNEARKLAEEVLGLIEVTQEGLMLTSDAHILLKMQEPVLYDVLHYLFYTAWRPEVPMRQARSWFYRTFCDRLWSMQDVILDKGMCQMLTQEMDGQIREEFQKVPGFSEKVSIGIQTVDGAREWLRHLQPPVIERESRREERFHRRTTCSTELFLLALSYCYRVSAIQPGMDMLVSAQRRDVICRLCLLEPRQFDRVLDRTMSIYPQLLCRGEKSRTPERSIRLHRFVTLDDLAY